jgi:hypothetical protein
MSTADSVPKADSKPVDDPAKHEPTAEEQAGWLSQATWYWLSTVMELGVERPYAHSPSRFSVNNAFHMPTCQQIAAV